jgi:hypothetical protein
MRIMLGVDSGADGSVDIAPRRRAVERILSIKSASRALVTGA